jgi:opacity protein-like surface antigen
MGCLKTLAYAGAVAMVASSTLLSAPASAADLGAPPMMAPPPPPPMVDGMSGLYLRGDIGVSHYGNSTHRSSFANTTVVVPGFAINNSSFDNVAFAGVGIGYQFNNWLRFDVTGEMRTTSRFSAIESYTNAWANPGCGVRCYDTYGASIGTNVFLANGYLDLGTWHGFTPFVGAGVGWANHKVTGLHDISPQPAGGFGISTDKSKSGMAWALMAGVGFEVTRNFKLELAYRYLDMGSITTNPINCQGVAICPQEVHRYGLNSHDVKIGFRYLFGGDAPPSMPVHAPLMRKF